jgi:creatinine amidohydrolase
MAERQAMRDAVAAGVQDLQMLRLEYWDHVTPETTARVFPNGHPGAQLEHAAVQETSLMLLLQPHLVDLAAIPGAGRHPADRVAAFPAYTIEPAEARPDWAPFSGVLSPANAASRDKGEWLMADHVAGIEAALRTEWGADALAGLRAAPAK